jgi:aquaporin Z
VKGTLATVKAHWPEYMMEAFGLGIFMISACTFGVLLFHPDSYLADVEHSYRNLLMGIVMGSTAIAIFKSPWGKRSGAHINPAVTLTFYRLGKIAGMDAVFYAIAQFAGAIIGVLISLLLLGSMLSVGEVNYVATVPGVWGIAAAFAGELFIAFVMMTTVLNIGNHPTLNRFTPYLAGLLVALYITFESPISGMSMNPARTLGSAVFADTWTGWWIYFTAPVLAMLGAAELYVRTRGLKRVLCAKLDHSGTARCIFRCNFHETNLVAQPTPEGRIEVTGMPRVTEVKGLF